MSSFTNELKVKPTEDGKMWILLEDFIKEWLDKQDKDVVKLLLEVFKEKGVLDSICKL